MTTSTSNSTAMPADQEFVITCICNAPRELVWKAWTEAERLGQWWGPKEFATKVSRLDLRPGGVFLYAMGRPNGQTMWGRFVYREIAAPERIVFIVSFSDETGGVTRNPWSAAWPLEVQNTLTLTETGGKTMVTLHTVPLNATEEERNTFAAGHDSMRQGFGGTFEQLAAYLTKA